MRFIKARVRTLKLFRKPMIKFNKILLLFLVFNISISTVYSADGDWCIEDPNEPPCGGAEGECTINRDGSPGGFVADSAYVEKNFFSFIWNRNNPTIDRYAQVCDTAEVTGRSQIMDHAKVRGDARVSDRVQVLGFAQVFGSAEIRGGAQIRDYAQVFESAKVSGPTQIFGNAKVHGHSRIYESAQVYDNAEVREAAWIYGQAKIYGSAQVYGSAKMYLFAQAYENAKVYGASFIIGSAQVYGNSEIYDGATISQNSRVFGEARIHGQSRVLGRAEVGGTANIFGNREVSGDEKICVAIPQVELAKDSENSENQVTRYVVYGSSDDEPKKTEANNLLKEIHSNENFFSTHECSICLGDELKRNFTQTKCGHRFCTDCLQEWQKDNDTCPYCRKPGTIENSLKVELLVNENETSEQDRQLEGSSETLIGTETSE